MNADLCGSGSTTHQVSQSCSKLMGQFNFYLLLLANSVAYAGPGSGSFFNTASGIQNRKNLEPGSRKNIPDHISIFRIVTIF